MKGTNFTWCYDKKGNAVKIYPYVTQDMKEVRSTKGTYIDGKIKKK